MRYLAAGLCGGLLVLLLGASQPTAGVVRCRALEVVDEAGRCRVVIETTPGGGGAVVLVGGDSGDSGAIMILAEGTAATLDAGQITADRFIRRPVR